MFNLTVAANIPAIIANLSIIAAVFPACPVHPQAPLAAHEPISDRAEIEDRIQDWARAIDRRDWALAQDVFHSGAIVNHGGVSNPDTLIARLAERP